MMFERLQKCIKDVIEGYSDEIKMSDRFQEDLDMDSVKLVMLQIAIEDEFQIMFEPLKDNFIEIFSTVATLNKFIEERCNERQL